MKLYPFIAFAANVCGLFVSLWLVHEHYSPSGGSAVCEIGRVVSCSRVLQSKWAVIMGVPVAVHGVAYFVVSVVVSGCTLLLRDGRAVRDSLAISLGVSFVGALACFHLVLIEYVLGALCPLCTIVHIVVVVSFLMNVLEARKSTRQLVSVAVARELVSFRLPWLLLVAVIVASPLFACPALEKRLRLSQEVLERVGACITKHGIRMFGDYACSNCVAQKALFGDAFKTIDYFECNAPGDPCAPFNITRYPTWHCLTDGDRITGVTPVSVLAHWADCAKELQ